MFATGDHALAADRGIIAAMPTEPRTELAVAGGGLAGMTLAIACAQAGIAVTLIDRL